MDKKIFMIQVYEIIENSPAASIFLRIPPGVSILGLKHKSVNKLWLRLLASPELITLNKVNDYMGYFIS